MNFKEIRYIIEISKSGNLSSAAENLSISQPSLSRYLKRVEEKYNTQFFFREGRYMVPTPAGKEYIAYASKMLPVLDHLETVSDEVTADLF